MNDLKVLRLTGACGVAALDTFNQPDPSVVRALTGASLASQTFEFILTALFLASASYAILATRAAEVDWLAGFCHCRPQPRSGSRDLWGERLPGSGGGRGDHLCRLVRLHQRCQGTRLYWVAPHRRHRDDAHGAGGRRVDAGLWRLRKSVR
jgi:hypothetical protein